MSASPVQLCKPLRVNFDCRTIYPGASGGVEGVAYGLINALGELESIELGAVVVPAGTGEAWRLRLGGVDETKIVETGSFAADFRFARLAKRRLRKLSWARRLVTSIRKNETSNLAEPDSVWVYPFHRTPIVHKPAVVIVHDLRSFTNQFKDVADQEIIRDNVSRAAAVVVSWLHPYNQLVELFPNAVDKLHRVPLPVLHGGASPVGARDGRSLGHLLYPAATSEHKNHRALIDAMKYMPGRRLICTGPLVEPQASELINYAKQTVGDRVSFSGYVDSETLSSLYDTASAVVIPSKWEAASGPLFEGALRGIPIAFANIPPLVDQVDSLGLIAYAFDPDDPISMARSTEQAIAGAEQDHAANARARNSLSEYSWRDAALGYFQILERTRL